MLARDRVEDYLEDAYGRRWRINPVSVYKDPTFESVERRGVQPGTSVVARMDVSVWCEIGPGQTLPDVRNVADKILASVTSGDDSSRIL